LDKEFTFWTQKEIKYLIKNYPTEDMEDMVNYLNRTDSAIKLKAHSLKLKRRKGYVVLQRILENQKKLMKQYELKSIAIIFLIIFNLVNGFSDFNGLNELNN
jgi:predicted nucleic acid-binding OB-fold protein